MRKQPSDHFCSAQSLSINSLGKKTVYGLVGSFSILDSISSLTPSFSVINIEEAEIEYEWITLRNLNINFPFSKIASAPWDLRKISITDDDGNQLEFSQISLDVFSVHLNEPIAVTVVFSIGDSKRSKTVRKPVNIYEKFSDDSIPIRQRLNFRIQNNPKQNHILIENNSEKPITAEVNIDGRVTKSEFVISGYPSLIALLTRKEWTAITKNSIVELKLRWSGSEDYIIKHDFVLSPPGINDYDTDLSKKRAYFEDGCQNIELEFKELPPGLGHESIEIHSKGIFIDSSAKNNKLRLKVPFKLSDHPIEFFVNKINRTYKVESFNEISEARCKIIHDRKNISFSGPHFDTPLISIDSSGNWEGVLMVNVLTYNNNLWQSIDLSENEYPIGKNRPRTISFKWLRNNLPDVDELLQQNFWKNNLRLKFEVFCGYERGPISFTTYVAKTESFIKVVREPYLVEGLPQSVIGSAELDYAQYPPDKKYEFEFHDKKHALSLIHNSRGSNKLEFYVPEEDLDKANLNDEWGLLCENRTIHSGKFLRPKLSFSSMRPRVLISNDNNLVVLPTKLATIHSEMLPRKTEMEIILEIGQNREKKFKAKTIFVSNSSPYNNEKNVSLSDFFDSEDHALIDAIKHESIESTVQILGKFCISFPSRGIISSDYNIYLEKGIYAEASDLFLYLKNYKTNGYLTPIDFYKSLKSEHRKVFVQVFREILYYIYQLDESRLQEYNSIVDSKIYSGFQWKQIGLSMRRDGLFIHSIFNNSCYENESFSKFFEFTKSQINHKSPYRYSRLRKIWRDPM